jgi:hypothetical protein
MRVYKDVWVVERDYRDQETLWLWLEVETVIDSGGEEDEGRYKMEVSRDALIDWLLDFVQTNPDSDEVKQLKFGLIERLSR